MDNGQLWQYLVLFRPLRCSNRGRYFESETYVEPIVKASILA